MKTDRKIALATVAVAVSPVLLIIAVFIFRFIYSVSVYVPQEGMWGCDEPYVRLDAANGLIEIEEDGAVNEYHIGWGDQLNYSMGILTDDGRAIDVTSTGRIELHGEKLHLRSGSGRYDFWLTKIEE